MRGSCGNQAVVIAHLYCSGPALNAVMTMQAWKQSVSILLVMSFAGATMTTASAQPASASVLRKPPRARWRACARAVWPRSRACPMPRPRWATALARPEAPGGRLDVRVQGGCVRRRVRAGARRGGGDPQLPDGCAGLLRPTWRRGRRACWRCLPAQGTRPVGVPTAKGPPPGPGTATAPGARRSWNSAARPRPAPIHAHTPERDDRRAERDRRIPAAQAVTPRQGPPKFRAGMKKPRSQGEGCGAGVGTQVGEYLAVPGSHQGRGSDRDRRCICRE